MAISKIKLPNNTVQDINDARNVVVGAGADNIVTLTLAEYEALSTKDPSTIYVITDSPLPVNIVALTQAQYEALTTKDSDTLYIITDYSEAGSGISSVVVSVGDNTGTPTGSATFSNGVLTIAFDNLKGADGADGQNGQPGPAGASSIMSKVSYTSSDTSVSNLAWDTIHVFPEMSSLSVSSFASVPSDGYEHELVVVFDTPSSLTGFALTLPSVILWGSRLNLTTDLTASTRYELRVSSSSMIVLYTEAALS